MLILVRRTWKLAPLIDLGSSSKLDVAQSTHRKAVPFHKWEQNWATLLSESVVFPLPKEARDPRSICSILPSNEVPSSKSLKKKTFSKSWTIFALHSLLEVNIQGQQLTVFCCQVDHFLASWSLSAVKLTIFWWVDQLWRWAHKSDLMMVILWRVIYCSWCNHQYRLRLVCHLESRKKSTLAKIWTRDPDHNLKWNLPSKWTAAVLSYELYISMSKILKTNIINEEIQIIDGDGDG